MGWLNKILKGTGHDVSGGQYHRRSDSSEVGVTRNAPSNSSGFHPKYEDEAINRAIALSLSEEEKRKGKAIDTRPNFEEDEQLARALQESLNVGRPPRHNGWTYDPFQVSFPLGFRSCAGCNKEIAYGRFLSSMNGVWHPECFCCHGCNREIFDNEFSVSGNFPYHKLCYKELYHPKCDVCRQFIPSNRAGLIEYRAHPFWDQKYCPSHEHDRTPRCCSCEKMEPRDTKFVTLDDGRRLCLECLHFAIMDNAECQPLYIEIQEFYEGLNMKVRQQIPLLLVERQALNEAMETERTHEHYHLPETRGMCLSEEQIVSSISGRPTIGPGSRIKDVFTRPNRLRRSEVTAILVIYGLPRLLTGSILTHEMMHAWLRLNGFRKLRPDVEEGICQVLAHMWLDSQIMSETGSYHASSSSSSSTSSKKGSKSQAEKKLGQFFLHQIESDTSPTYGDGFRAANRAVQRHGLRCTLNHMKSYGSFPY